MSWTDTLDVPVRADAFDATERSLTSYRAIESDDPRLKKAVKLESTGSYQRKGKGTQYDQQLEMTASGTRSSIHYLNPDGTLAAARGSDAGDLTITIPAVGQTVPVKQAGTFTIRSLRPPKR
jgi:acid phosphatase class B